MPALSRRYSTTISIHALLAESDPLKNAITAVPQQISIHALLAESDLRPCFSRSFLSNFYPRSPCGERPYGRINDISRLIFLSTLSLRRATAEAANNRAEQQISIHALLAESDRKGLAIRWNTCISIHALLAESDETINVRSHGNNDFYPRSPCGERPRDSRSVPRWHAISIHALLAESD